MASNLGEIQSGENIPPQRQTTLKWSPDGELSEIDMARILSRLNNTGLTSCDITCDLDENLKNES
tara:strand:- start:2028 stop:2222 length:195 start_codon:yes stop_codon:yes gene_type:complete